MKGIRSIKYHGACLGDGTRDRRKVWKELKAQSPCRCLNQSSLSAPLRAITVDGTEWSVTVRFTLHQHIGHKPRSSRIGLSLWDSNHFMDVGAACCCGWTVPVGFVLLLKMTLNSNSRIVTLTTSLVPRQSNVLVAAVHKSTRCAPCSLYNSSVVCQGKYLLLL